MKSVGSLCAVALLAASSLTAQAKKGDVAKGKESFEMCAGCHAVEGEEKKMGPSLAGLYKKDKMKNGKKPTDATVKAVIDQGGNGMPAYADMLTDEEKANILAYLHTL
jgi:mono/diheme cytochrome c family protein